MAAVARLAPVATVSARRSVVAHAEARPTWYPGAVAPKHLKGEMAGDYGFDPLRLGVNAEALPYYREAERMNARWAMLAVAGILTTDLIGAGDFWTAGAKPGATGSFDLQTLIIIEVVFFAVVESLRYRKWRSDPNGTSFDPAGMRSSETEVKEIKNGRLAMVAFIGFCSQAAVRGMGPLECLKAHIADPWNNNIFTSSVGNEAAAAVVALSIAPMFIEAQKSLGRDDKEEFRPIPW